MPRRTSLEAIWDTDIIKPGLKAVSSRNIKTDYLHLDFVNLILEKCIEIFGLIEFLFTMSKLRRVNQRLYC